ncbi:MAG TPA: basic secretory protein-like protein [Fimbriimonadaceae bacterium]|jgi:hypothetical protein
MVHKWSTFSFAVLVCLLATGVAIAKVQGVQIPQISASVDSSGGSPTDQQNQELQQIANKAATTSRAQYQMIVRLLGAQKNYQPPTFTIAITYDYKGVAGTAHDHTDVSANYALKHPDDIPGVMVHELTHVVQHYTHKSPGWLVEGIADYVRWYNYEPVSKRHTPHASRAEATGSYQTTANFLDWAVKTYNKNLVKQLNQELYDGTYTDDSWPKLTGHTLDQLNTEWKQTLPP